MNKETSRLERFATLFINIGAVVAVAFTAVFTQMRNSPKKENKPEKAPLQKPGVSQIIQPTQREEISKVEEFIVSEKTGERWPANWAKKELGLINYLNPDKVGYDDSQVRPKRKSVKDSSEQRDSLPRSR